MVSTVLRPITCSCFARKYGIFLYLGSGCIAVKSRVEKRRPGIGSGPNARPAERFILVGKSKNGSYKWVDKKKRDDAIRARKNGTATKAQKEMLDNGKAFEQVKG